MKKFIFPDFNNNVLNISSTLSNFLGGKNDNPTLKILEEELNKNYKNIIYICFDGLGIHPININLDNNSIIKNNIKQILTSTFPSTTTNATNSLLINKYPLEHGWFGWSMYFENIGKNIDIFLDVDSASKEKVNIKNSPLKIGKYYFDDVSTDYNINTVFPPYVRVENEKQNHVFKDMNDFFNNILCILNKPGKQFIYAYNGEPDTTMHEFGVTSEESKKLINFINDKVNELYKKTKNTLFIISADHGQIDVKGYVDLYHDNKLMEMLEIYPFLDARAVAFKVKKDKLDDFENYFKNKYSEDFVLYKSKDLIDMGVFGPRGDMGFLLGDFIAIGTYTHKIAIMTPSSHEFKGHHTSLTEEMEVPLILLNN